MKKLLIFWLLIVLSLTLNAQQEKLDIEGSVQIGDSEDPSPDPGTIRWTGTDFLGWNGKKWISLTTGTAFDGEVTDIDGNSYRTIMIGNQEWMVENLRTTHYADGSLIPMVNNPDAWAEINYGAWCWYDTLSTCDLPYGKLYNWYAVNDSRDLCPDNWHVPSQYEWDTLFYALAPLPQAGGKMKEAGTANWKAPNTGATNESGFTALPGGWRNGLGTFDFFGTNGYWWSSTEFGDNASSILLFSNDAGFGGLIIDKHLGFSVRCIKGPVP